MEAKKEIKEILRAKFEKSLDLQAEFGGDVDSYLAFKAADGVGRVRIITGGCLRMSVEQFNNSVELERLNEKLGANQAELKRLEGLQKKSAEAEKAEIEACGVACGVDGLPLEE